MNISAPSASSQFTPANRSAAATAAGPVLKNRGAAGGSGGSSAGPLLMPLLESRQRTAKSPAHSHALQRQTLAARSSYVCASEAMDALLPFWSCHVAL